METSNGVLACVSLLVLSIASPAFGRQPGAGAPIRLAGDQDPAAKLAPIVNLGDLLQRDLDAAFQRQLAAARGAAADWQDDARLNKVQLRLSDAGEISWVFHFLSDASSGYLRVWLFSRGGEPQADAGEDPEAVSKPTLEPADVAGFSRAVRALDEAGVDLAAVSNSELNQFELSHQRWREPAGYYYNLFLASRAPYWIVAESGRLQQ